MSFVAGASRKLGERFGGEGRSPHPSTHVGCRRIRLWVWRIVGCPGRMSTPGIQCRRSRVSQLLSIWTAMKGETSELRPGRSGGDSRAAQKSALARVLLILSWLFSLSLHYFFYRYCCITLGGHSIQEKKSTGSRADKR